jgi:hypothetical protein
MIVSRKLQTIGPAIPPLLGERAGVRASYSLPTLLALTENPIGVPSLSPGLAVSRPTPGNTFHNPAADSEAAQSAKLICGHPIRPIRPILPRPKSTFAIPKSTVDLGCEPLIRVENSLIPPPSPTCYRPISAPKIKGFNQTQAVTDQKIILLAAANGGRDTVTPLQGLTSKALHPICVNSRNSRKKLRVSVVKKEILILLFSWSIPSRLVQPEPT